ncbi:f-box domain protein [Seiridium cupressi]
MESLPSEILIQVLELFPTQSLLPLALISHRFHGLVSRLHYARIVEAISLLDHELILECYHPSAKISTPYMFCDYLGTDGLEEVGQNPGLKGIGELYSRYRPVLGEEHRRPRARYATKAVIEGSEQPINEQPSHDLYLESAELFSQLCTVINLIKVGPKRGLFLSYVNVIESVIRIWREWLARESSDATTKPPGSSILWTDSSQNFGLKLKVVEKPDTHAPILVGPGEDPPVSYTLEYEGSLKPSP